jgi:hypothetical protein
LRDLPTFLSDDPEDHGACGSSGRDVRVARSIPEPDIGFLILEFFFPNLRKHRGSRAFTNLGKSHQFSANLKIMLSAGETGLANRK